MVQQLRRSITKRIGGAVPNRLTGLTEHMYGLTKHYD